MHLVPFFVLVEREKDVVRKERGTTPFQRSHLR